MGRGVRFEVERLPFRVVGAKSAVGAAYCNHCARARGCMYGQRPRRREAFVWGEGCVLRWKGCLFVWWVTKSAVMHQISTCVYIQTNESHTHFPD